MVIAKLERTLVDFILKKIIDARIIKTKYEENENEK